MKILNEAAYKFKFDNEKGLGMIRLTNQRREFNLAFFPFHTDIRHVLTDDKNVYVIYINRRDQSIIFMAYLEDRLPVNVHFDTRDVEAIAIREDCEIRQVLNMAPRKLTKKLLAFLN
jgi:hypothetical protein